MLYDRPPAVFAKPSLEAANELWQRLARDLNLGARRIPLVVCPTSWTPDEDFDLLLEALERAERVLQGERKVADGLQPEIAVLMTGRGQLREDFERVLREGRCTASPRERSGSSPATIPCSSGWRMPDCACTNRRRASICR